MRGSILVIVGLAVAALCTACTMPMSTSVIDSPRTVARGSVGATLRVEEFNADLVADNANVDENGDASPAFSPWPLIGMAFRTGLSDRADLGVRLDGAFFIPMWLPNALTADVKLQLTPDESDVAVGVWTRAAAGGFTAETDFFGDHETYKSGFVAGAVGVGVELRATPGLALRLNGELARAKIWGDASDDDPTDTFATTIPTLTVAVALGERVQFIPYLTITNVRESPYGGYTFINGGFAISRGNRGKGRGEPGPAARAPTTAPGPAPANSLPPSMTPPI